MFQYRTDLALESGALFDGAQVEGVSVSEVHCHGWSLTRVDVNTQQGSDRLGKPMGRYLTLDLSDYSHAGPDALRTGVQAVSYCLRTLLPKDLSSVMVVGLGNRSITADAVGPRGVDHVLVTRHLGKELPQFFPVSALAPGVLGTTGVESGEIVDAVCDSVQPDALIVIDALAARSLHRLCNTLQFTDTGITPGSGVGNARKALNRATLHLPVIALGVPTVVDGATLARDFGVRGDPGLEEVLVTPKDIDARIAELARLIGYGINACFHPHLTAEEMEYYLK